jgi:hypothetical protein
MGTHGHGVAVSPGLELIDLAAVMSERVTSWPDLPRTGAAPHHVGVSTVEVIHALPNSRHSCSGR